MAILQLRHLNVWNVELGEGCSQEELQNLISTLDPSGDGAIDKDEFMEILVEMGELPRKN